MSVQFPYLFPNGNPKISEFIPSLLKRYSYPYRTKALKTKHTIHMVHKMAYLINPFTLSHYYVTVEIVPFS